MKTLLCTLILATLGTVAAKADTVTITFDQANQSAAAGDTLQFFGTITNDTDQRIYLGGDALNLDGLSFTINDLFLDNTPPFLNPAGQAGDSTGDVELFDVTVSSPLADSAGIYSGTYNIIGGATPDAQDLLEDPATSFSITTTPSTSPVPEPASIVLLFSGLSAAWVPFRNRRRK